MFKHLTQFEFVRNRKQACGFYVAYILLSIAIAAPIGTIAGLLAIGEPFDTGKLAGEIVAIVFCIVLALIVVSEKRLFSSFKGIVVMILSAILLIFVGLFAALLPIAYLTTQAVNENK